ncbi:MAG TPA: ABC transporter substrate-binding protein [Stellaceae bacterium]|nr:ABC transporter substrate-binding protein [Stellaceae bacterium]
MKRLINRRDVALGAAAGALAVSFPGRRARAALPPLKLGVLLPRSGFQALIGQGCQRGFDVAVKVVREMGVEVELINADTESKPEVARTQAERLIRDGAQIISGAFDSGQTAAAAQVCEQHGVPFVINIGADPAITEQGYKFVFRNFLTSIMLGSGSLKRMGELFAATHTAPKTAALMIVNDTFGQGFLKGLNAMLPKAGLPFEIVKTVSYDPQANDLSVEVAQAKAANADLHLAVTRLNDGILMIREMVKQRYEPMGVISPGAPGFYERQFTKVLGKYAEYNFSINAWMDPKQALTKTLEAAFYKDFPDQSFDLNIGFSFEAVMIAADAYKRAGSSRPDALVEALRATDLAKRVMVGGPIRFNEKGQNVDTGMAVLQIRNEKPTVVLPESNAELAPIFPVPGWTQRG